MPAPFALASNATAQSSCSSLSCYKHSRPYQINLTAINHIDRSTNAARSQMVPACVHRMMKRDQWRRNEFESGGHQSSAKVEHRNIFSWSCPATFLALKVQFVALVSAFVTVSTVWTVSCLLFFYSLCPPCPDICKSGGGHVLPCPMEPAPLNETNNQATHFSRPYSNHSISMFGHIA